jgi:hypothetical protein
MWKLFNFCTISLVGLSTCKQLNWYVRLFCYRVGLCRYINDDKQIVPMLKMLRQSGRLTFLVTNRWFSPIMFSSMDCLQFRSTNLFTIFGLSKFLISCEGHSFLVQTRECVGTAIGSSLVVGLTEISRKTALLLFNVDVSPIVHAMSWAQQDTTNPPVAVGLTGIQTNHG